MSALWLRAIAIRPTNEYETSEIWKLHIYTSMRVALAREGGATVVYT